jgi:hypothetical protein
VVRRLTPLELTLDWVEPPSVNARTVAFVACVLVAVIAVSALLPAWRASTASPADTLKENAAAITGSGRRRFRWLVTAELATATMLVVLAGLLTLALVRLETRQFGFDARKLIAATVALPRAADSLTQTARYTAREHSLASVRQVQGVASAFAVGSEPTDGWQVTAIPNGAAPRVFRLLTYWEVDAGFFHSLRVPVLEGRDFSETDRAAGGAVILSRDAARHFFGAQVAVGSSMKLGRAESPRPVFRVVGIVPDFDLTAGIADDRSAPPWGAVYASTNVAKFEQWRVAVRPARKDPAIALQIVRTLSAAMPARSLLLVEPWIANYESRLRLQAFLAMLAVSVGMISLLLGAAGLFSAVTYAVEERMPEFAVRAALGASRRSILFEVSREIGEMVIGGTAIGALLSFWASSALQSFLPEVSTADPFVLVAAEVTMLVVCACATAVPAIRAMHVDPGKSLRMS